MFGRHSTIELQPRPWKNIFFVCIEYSIHMEILRVNIDSIECLQLRPKRFMGGGIAQWVKCLLRKPETWALTTNTQGKVRVAYAHSPCAGRWGQEDPRWLLASQSRQLAWPHFSEGVIPKTVMECDWGRHPVRQGRSWHSDRDADGGNACLLGFLPLPFSFIQLSHPMGWSCLNPGELFLSGNSP